MSNNPFFTDAVVLAAVNNLAANCNGGTLNIYAGSQPADANTAITGQTLLVTLPLSATAFANAVASGAAGSRVVTATANPITAGTAVANGTAAWFRVLSSSSAVVFDGSCGGAGFDLTLSSTMIGVGAIVSVSSFTISQNE